MIEEPYSSFFVLLKGGDSRRGAIHILIWNLIEVPQLSYHTVVNPQQGKFILSALVPIEVTELLAFALQIE